MNNNCTLRDAIIEVIIMAKKGMRRPDPREPHGTESNHKMHLPKNDMPHAIL